ncbi:hypothetical protein FQN60_011463 [Etheostoma spectabile]|uniref:Uncharacterized protein n=1 Tax=Etheostoma spectabile TaxID=54343 RepID=A0A5J5CBQ2_9PERO|nr:hypothetical protein FQN60_011463 [Etheostoma spectabile]
MCAGLNSCFKLKQCFGLQAHVLCMFVFRKFCRINKMMELMPYAIHLMVSHRCVRPPPCQVSPCPLFTHCCVRPPPSQVSLCPLFSHCCVRPPPSHCSLCSRNHKKS